jgi:hypothetical protein
MSWIAVLFSRHSIAILYAEVIYQHGNLSPSSKYSQIPRIFIIHLNTTYFYYTFKYQICANTTYNFAYYTNTALNIGYFQPFVNIVHKKIYTVKKSFCDFCNILNSQT